MINKPMLAVAGVVILAAAGAWYYFHTREPALPPTPIASEPAAAAPADAPAIQHPVPPAAPPAAGDPPLPSLEDSDQPLSAALAALDAGGEQGVGALLMPKDLVRHLVVTIDNLPRAKVPVDRRPTVSAPGAFVADGDELHGEIDARNFERYKPMVDVLNRLDLHKLVAVYFHFYPLFQRAYQDLGYPNGYFNDRLVETIDVLEKTPQPAAPIALVRPNVMYQFADPSLEARPAGQKLLIRMGPENAAVIKAKLIELRALITATPPQH